MNPKEFINNIFNIRLKENFINMYLETILYDFPFINSKCIEKCLISNRYLNTIGNSKFTTKGLEKIYLSDKEIIELSREIINDINPHLVKKFDQLYEDKKIKLKKSEIYDIINKHPAYLDIKSNKHNVLENIILYKNPDYNSICTLIHEFMHITNSKIDFSKRNLKCDLIIRKEFTEFISIYFEFYAREYLINKYNIENNKIDFSERFNTNNKLAKEDLYNYLPYLCYTKYKKVNYNTCENVIKDYNIIIDISENEYINIINNFYKNNKRFIESTIDYEQNKNTYEESSTYDRLFLMFWNDVCKDNYVLSTLLYFSVQGKLTKNEILKFNDSISKDNGDLAKYKDPNFKLVIDYYKRLNVDDYTYSKLEEFINSTYTKDGILKKVYTI